MPASCYRCQKCFSTKSNLHKHIKIVHHINNASPIIKRGTKYLCVECNLTYNRNEDLRHHLEKTHDFENMVEEWTFENHNAFTVWLNQEQKTHKVRYYVRGTGEKVATRGVEKQYFECKGSHSSSQGKLRTACVSQIIVKKKTATDECLVTYFRSHYLLNISDSQQSQRLKISKSPFEMKNVTGNEDPQNTSKSIPLTLDDLGSLRSDDDQTKEQNVDMVSESTDKSEIETPNEDVDHLRKEIKLILMQIITSVENNHLSKEQLEQILKHLNECIVLTKK